MALPSSVLLNYWNQICPYPAQQLYQTEGTLHLRSLSVLDGFDLVRPLRQNKTKPKINICEESCFYVHIKLCNLSLQYKMKGFFPATVTHRHLKSECIWKGKVSTYQKPVTETPKNTGYCIADCFSIVFPAE